MNPGHFPPPKRRGLIAHGILLLILLSIAVTAFNFLTRSPVGPTFLFWLLLALASFAPIPFFAYRGYSLVRADYAMDRDSLTLNWGLRLEQIPLSNIEWIRSAEDLTQPLRLPSLRLPGGILGIRRHPDLGSVEFLAADTSTLLLVATTRRVFVISPQDPAALAQTFARATELGSTSPVDARSVFPSFIVAQAWDSALARYLWLSTLFLNLGLFIWASLIIPSTPRVALGPQFVGGPGATVAASQLIVFPVASLLSSVVGWIAGLYFFRRERERILAWIMWLSSTLSSLLFLLAVLFVVSTPV